MMRDAILILCSVAGTALLFWLLERRENFTADWYRTERKWDAPVATKGPWDVAVARTVPLRQATTLWLPPQERKDPVEACGRTCSADPLCKAFGTIISGESKGLCHLYQDLTLPPLVDATAYSNYAMGYQVKDVPRVAAAGGTGGVIPTTVAPPNMKMTP